MIELIIRAIVVRFIADWVVDVVKEGVREARDV